MRDLLNCLGDHLADIYDHMRDVQITPEVSATDIRRHLNQRYGNFGEALSAGDVLNDVTEMMHRWNLQVTHPCYFGLFNPSIHPAGIMADALVAAFNPQLAVWSHAPAANEIERHTLRYLAACIGMDPDASFACFTTGGAEANQSAILVALTRALPAYARQGLSSLPHRPAIYVSTESHHSLEKIAHAAGIGRDAVRYVEVDAGLRLDLHALRERVQADRNGGYLPLMVVATAGTTGAGAIDPMAALAEICRQEELWFHVDAAWGGAACLSPKLKRCLAGIECADSITWDAHKWLSVPMGAGMFFCAHPESVARTFEIATPYMPPHTEDTTDPYVTTTQWSRRHIGLKLFMTLATLGARGYQEIIEHQAEMGDLLRDELGRRAWRIVNETSLPVICYTHPAITDGVVSTSELVRRLQAKNLWISEVRLAGASPVLRACITSFRTQPEDILTLVDELTAIVKG